MRKIKPTDLKFREIQKLTGLSEIAVKKRFYVKENRKKWGVEWVIEERKVRVVSEDNFKRWTDARKKRLQKDGLE